MGYPHAVTHASGTVWKPGASCYDFWFPVSWPPFLTHKYTHDFHLSLYTLSTEGLGSATNTRIPNILVEVPVFICIYNATKFLFDTHFLHCLNIQISAITCSVFGQIYCAVSQNGGKNLFSSIYFKHVVYACLHLKWGKRRSIIVKGPLWQQWRCSCVCSWMNYQPSFDKH